MPVSVLTAPPVRKNVRMKHLDDSTLLTTIAQNRDMEAFNELVRRYEKPLFNLAKFLIRTREGAEEAVQSALYEVWRCADSYRPGNARGWIMSIATRRCHHLARKGKIESKTTNMEQNHSDIPSTRQPPSERAERAELLGALRRELSRLSTTEREMVFLYYGGGISHAKIGKTLGIPQRTVAFKISRVLEQVGGKLKSSGFAAAVGLLNTEGTLEALTTGESVPVGLHAKILETVSSGPTPEVIGTSGHTFRAVPLALIAVAVISGTYFATTPTTPEVNSAPPPSTEASSTAPTPRIEKLVKATTQEVPQVVQTSEPFRHHWTFENPEPSPQLKVVKGHWERVHLAERNLWAMQVKENTAVLLSPQLRPQPHVVTLKAVIQEAKKWGIFNLACELANDQGVVIENHFQKFKLVFSPRSTGQVIVTQSVMLGKYLLRETNGKTSSFRTYNSPYPATKLYLPLKNVKLIEIEYRSLDADEISFWQKKMEKFKNPNLSSKQPVPPIENQ